MLKHIHNNFIITRADKAANNYIFICLKYYAKNLCAELGVDVNNKFARGNKTYQLVNKQASVTNI